MVGRHPKRLVRESADDGVARYALAATATAPLVRLHHTAGEHRPVRLEPLAGDLQAEIIKAAERGQVRAAEAPRGGSVGHVEVFRMGGVGTSIFGRPRRLSPDRRASVRYTLIWEEPLSPRCAARFSGLSRAWR